jgi:cytochrome b subunit of formate dehydrogenase
MLSARIICANFALGFAFLLAGGAVYSQYTDAECLECHDDVVVDSAAHEDVGCGECHTNVKDRKHRRGLEPLTDEESCGECHARTLRTVNRSIHKDEASCNDCHGDPHQIKGIDKRDCAVSSVNQLQQCGACHDTPEMPLELYITSEHGRALLLSGLTAAPSCSACHGSHQIAAVDDERSRTSHLNSPEMCGECHTMLLDDWVNQGAHGAAWQAGEDGPVCTDCHSTHAIVDPTSDESRLEAPDMCGGCHEEFLATFRHSFHGQVNDLGMPEGATCSDCHTPHKNLPAADPRSSVHPDNLAETCGNCHGDVNENFLGFDPHNDETDPEDHFGVYVIWIAMTGLLIGVFAFFGVHDLLWLQRSLVGVLRGEYEEPANPSGKYVRRFNKMNIRTHIVIISTFLILALTGLPLKFHDMAWAQVLMTMLGGVDVARFLHRVAAIGTFGYLIFHVGNIFIRLVFKNERGLFWGPNSMMPQPKDVADLFANVRHFLYLGERPQGDRWTYFEKFDYLAVFWGVLVIGLSGLMLWIPEFFARFLPGWILNAAHVIHSDEALLATGFIFVFHFFHTHLRPESFPMDAVVFTGRMSLERFRSERPLEYQRLVDNNELENYLVDPPAPHEMRLAHVWGTIFLSIGVALAIGIIWALLSH